MKSINNNDNSEKAQSFKIKHVGNIDITRTEISVNRNDSLGEVENYYVNFNVNMYTYELSMSGMDTRHTWITTYIMLYLTKKQMYTVQSKEKTKGHSSNMM